MGNGYPEWASPDSHYLGVGKGHTVADEGEEVEMDTSPYEIKPKRNVINK